MPAHGQSQPVNGVRWKDQRGRASIDERFELDRPDILRLALSRKRLREIVIVRELDGLHDFSHAPSSGPSLAVAPAR